MPTADHQPAEPVPSEATVEAQKSMRAAYGASAASWAEGPARIYRQLAAHLVRRTPWPLAGRRIIDIGTGTGVLAEALVEAGASVVTLDLAFGMVRHGAERRPPAMVGDATLLPLRDHGLDAAGAAFSLTHVPAPERALAEVRRVTRPGGHLLAMSYHAENDHPVKRAADGAAASLGFVAPHWHGTIKHQTEPAFASVGAVTQLLTACGFSDVAVTTEHVDLGIDDPRAMVDWRLGMASLAPFVAGLTSDQRAHLVQQALDELGPHPESYRPHVIIATATTP